MKNLLIVSALALAAVVVVGLHSTALAAECGQVDINGNLVTCNNGDPLNVTQPWGLNGHQTPVIAAGVTVADEAGITDTCPTWMKWGCFNVFSTDYYRNQARTIAHQLQQRGFTVGKYAYWLNN